MLGDEVGEVVGPHSMGQMRGKLKQDELGVMGHGEKVLSVGLMEGEELVGG